MATLVFFQFVFAAITVIILAGSVLGRMNFKAWVIFCPIWMTFVYTIGAFSLWGGGWLATLGAVDFSGGYVIHLAAGTSGFVAAAVIGPRLQADRDSCPDLTKLLFVMRRSLQSEAPIAAAMGKPDTEKGSADPFTRVQQRGHVWTDPGAGAQSRFGVCRSVDRGEGNRAGK